MKNKFANVLASMCLVTVMSFTSSCGEGDSSSPTNATLPDVNIEDISNYEINEQGTLFDIHTLLPELPKGAEITFSAKSNGANVTIIDGKLALVAGKKYDITVEIKLGTDTKVEEFSITTKGYVSADEDLPKLSFSNVSNYKVDNNLYNIKALLPEIKGDYQVAYTVTSSKGDVSVVDGTIFIEKGEIYHIAVTVTRGNKTETGSFILTTEGYVSVDEELPKLTFEDVSDYVVSTNLYNIKALLPEINGNYVVAYTVTNTKGSVSVVDGTIFIEKGEKYNISVTVTRGNKTETGSFTLTTEGYVDADEALPEIKFSNVFNYKVENNLYDIKPLLPAISGNYIVSYVVKNTKGSVSVVDGTFYIEKGERYDIVVTVTRGNKTATGSFILTTEDYAGSVENTSEYALINFPLATEFAGKTYNFGSKKITNGHMDGSNYVVESVEDQLTLDYSITSLSTNSNADDTAIILIDGYLAGSDEANAIATIDIDNKVDFNVNGEHSITILSSLDVAASATLNVNINEGYNIYSLEELRHSFAETASSTIKPVNIQNDIVFEEGSNPFTSALISVKGETIYGNSHVIDASKMARAVYTKQTGDAARNLSVLNFVIANGASTSIEVNDLTVYGNGKYNDEGYKSGEYHPKDVLCGITIIPTSYGTSFDNDPTLGNFDYATRGEDGLKVQLSSKHSAYRHRIGNAKLENVNIMNTLTGLRLQNIENVVTKNLTSKNSFLNNIECYQLENAVFEDTFVGYSGGAAIELKEDMSKLYKYDMTPDKTAAAMWGDKVMYHPANAYDANTVINEFGCMTAGNVLLSDGSIKDINALTEADQPMYVAKRTDNNYKSNQRITIKGKFECDNWTAGDEVYYMQIGNASSPDSSYYLIGNLKALSPESVKIIDGKEKINYSIAALNWAQKNYSEVIIESNSSFGFYEVPVELYAVVPNASSWAFKEASRMYVNVPVKSVEE